MHTDGRTDALNGIILRLLTNSLRYRLGEVPGLLVARDVPHLGQRVLTEARLAKEVERVVRRQHLLPLHGGQRQRGEAGDVLRALLRVTWCKYRRANERYMAW